MRRVLILGTGTGVGKTHVTAALARALGAAQPGLGVQALKPIETGLRARRGSGAPPAGSDAARLEAASTTAPLRPHPIYAFPRPVSAHLESRRLRRPIRTQTVLRHLSQPAVRDATLPVVHWQMVETAGGVFSPLSARTTNFDLARALEPAVWVLVAPDALGVLHDVRATLLAMQTLGRAPDFLVLSESRERDASTGRNAAELPRVGLPTPIAVVDRRRRPERALRPLVRALLAK